MLNLAQRSLRYCVEGGYETDGRVSLPYVGRDELPEFFHSRGFRSGAEIGVWRGAYAEQLCQAMPGLTLLCVDPYESYEAYEEQRQKPQKIGEAERGALARLEPYGCRFLKMRSTQAALEVPDGSLDFVYIDGNHAEAYVLADLEAWTPKVRRGGIVAGHDYKNNPERPFIQVKAAVDRFTTERGIRPWFVLGGDKQPSYFWVVQ